MILKNGIPKKTKIKAGVFQFDIVPGDLKSNVKRAFLGIEALCRAGTDIIVLPELWSCGFDIPNMAVHAGKTPGILSRLKAVSEKHHVFIGGSLPEKKDGMLYNTFFLIGPDGQLVCAYRKIHLFAPMCENECFSPGDRLTCCETSIGKIGLATCYDLRFPEVFRSLALKDARLILVSAHWPHARIMHWEILLRARAIENQVFIMGVNACGAGKSPEFSGHSCIIAPEGEILASAGTKPGYAAAMIDLDTVERVRKRFSSLYERIPEAYD